MSNPRPRLGVYERHLLCRRVREQGWSVIAAARAAGISRQSAHKWLRRFDAEDLAGLDDRSSRPHRMPRLTRIDLAVAICVERQNARSGPHQLSYALRIARSTIYAVLRRAGMNRLASLVVRRPVLRYEWPSPGDLVHLDVKRFARIGPGGGWRNLGRAGGDGRRAIRRPDAGYEYAHVAVDDHSRWPDVLMATDELAHSAVVALEAVSAAYARVGVRIRRILTDNGSCYRSLDFAAACRRLGIEHWRTRPYTPRTNGKAERFIKTLQLDWAYTRLYRSSHERRAALPGFLAAYRVRPNVALHGHTPSCRFPVNNVSGNHS